MLLKIVSATPLMAVLVGFITTNFERLDSSPFLESVLNFVIIGQLPGTEIYIRFEAYLLLFVTLLWLPLIVKSYRLAKAIIEHRIDHTGRLSLISL